MQFARFVSLLVSLSSIRRHIPIVMGGNVKQCHGHMAYRDLCHSLSSQTNVICQVKVLPVLTALQQKTHKLQSILFCSSASCATYLA